MTDKKLWNEFVALEKERDALRARIEAMERQEPVGTLHDDGCFVWSTPRPYESNYAGWKMKLYLAPGAQPAPIAQDESARKAWVRFSNAVVSGDDAPYPGMSEAFEQHFSQSFTDREWRAESGTWAAAWKAAKRHGAQPAPSVPECPYPCGWQNLFKHAIEDGAYLARSINEDEPVTENARAVTMRTVMRLRDVLMAINNAAPEVKL